MQRRDSVDHIIIFDHESPYRDPGLTLLGNLPAIEFYKGEQEKYVQCDVLDALHDFTNVSFDALFLVVHDSSLLSAIGKLLMRCLSSGRPVCLVLSFDLCM